MKIIHSYWTLPTIRNGYIRNTGIWLNKKYNFISWMLSALQFLQFYENVELITDDHGKVLLIDKLNLPYTHVSQDLNRLNNYNPGLWGLSKIYAYGVQNEPFIHVDGDLYIWKKFDQKLENSPLVAQHLEVNFDYYEGMIDEVKYHFDYIPDYLCREEWGVQDVFAYNSGILGGNDVDFLNEYAKETFTFLKRNRECLHKIRVRNLAVFDQYFFYCFAREHGKENEVACYFDNMDPGFTGLDDFKGVPSRSHFLHLLYTHKKSQKNCEALESRLRKDYPEYYYRIIGLLKNHEV
ncbi:MAG: DUF6734 family protein [Balneolaceae bacterium]